MTNPFDRVGQAFNSVVKAIRQHVPGADLVMTVNERVNAVGGGPASSAIAMAAFLSLFPLLLVAIAVLGFFAADDTNFAQEAIERLGLDGKAADTVLDAINTAERSRRTATVLGLVGLLWSGLGVVSAVEYALNAVWQTRGFGLVGKLRHVAWVAGAGLLLFTSLAVGPLLNVLPGSAAIPSLLVGLVVDTTLFLWTFHQLTNAPVLWKHHLPGAILGGIGLAILKLLGGVLVPQMVTSASTLYGSIGVVFAILAWLVLGAKLVVYSAAYNVVRYERDHGTDTVELEVPHIAGHVPIEPTRGGAVANSSA